MRRLNKAQMQELDALRADDGKLYVRDVVEKARSADSALHGRFEWDDAKAAESYRLEQARAVIEIYIRVVDGRDTRAYVSLAADRASGGGYVPTDEAVSESVTRRMLVQQLKDDVSAVLRRYTYLRPAEPEVFARLEQALIGDSPTDDVAVRAEAGSRLSSPR